MAKTLVAAGPASEQKPAPSALTLIPAPPLPKKRALRADGRRRKAAAVASPALPVSARTGSLPSAATRRNRPSSDRQRRWREGPSGGRTISEGKESGGVKEGPSTALPADVLPAHSSHRVSRSPADLSFATLIWSGGRSGWSMRTIEQRIRCKRKLSVLQQYFLPIYSMSNRMGIKISLRINRQG